MIVLPDGYVTLLRNTQERYMPSTVTITDPGDISEDPDTGATIIGDPTTTTTIGRLSTTGTTRTIQEFGAQLAADADFVLTVPVGNSLTEGRQVTVNGTDYTIVSEAKATDWGTAVRALVVEGRTVGG